VQCFARVHSVSQILPLVDKQNAALKWNEFLEPIRNARMHERKLFASKTGMCTQRKATYCCVSDFVLLIISD
jgi:hypothetical protein